MRIFLSCVSNELGSYRRKLADHLRSRLTASETRAAEPLEIRSQEDFEQGDYTLLERLADYIGQCDQEIHLVGDLCGSRPTAEHVRAMFARLGQPSSDPDSHLSYTQWEYGLARMLNKPVKCYVASNDAPRDCDPSTAQSEEEAQLQREYVARLKASGEHRSEFTGHVDLLKQVLNDMALGCYRKVNNLPHTTLGKQFKGREEFLQQLRKTLGEAEHQGYQQVIAITAPASVATVYGLGGVGKTRTALEYAHRFADEYTALLFVEANTPEQFEINLANLCGAAVFNLAEREARETAVKVGAVREWLVHHPGWFLILDNVDTPEAAKTVHRFLGSLGQSGQTVITSRLANWPAGMESLALDLLKVEDAAEFLLERTETRRPVNPDDEKQARDLAVELGQLALALEQAGALIIERAYSFAEYRHEWHKNSLAVLGWFDESVMLYPRSVATTWQTSFNLIGDHAQRLLRMVCWLATDPIPISILNDEVLLFCLGGNAEEVNTRAALGDLARFSLATFQSNSQTFVVHRLVQEVTRTTIPEDVKNGYLKSSLGWIDSVFQGNPEDPLLWPVLDLLAPHAETVAELADAQGIPWQTARLFSDLGALYYSERQDVKAEALMNRALEIDEKFCGPDSARVAIRLGNLATLLIENSRLEEAERLIRRALKIDETINGPAHPVVAIRLLTLARLLKITDRATEAEQILRRALAIDYIASGPWHADVARDLDALGVFLLANNRAAEADPLFRRVLEIDERTLEPMHPFLALHLNNLAALLIAVNQLAEAEPLMRRALGVFRHVAGTLGKAPPHSKNAIENYIRLLLLMGNTEDQIQTKLNDLASALSPQ